MSLIISSIAGAAAAAQASAPAVAPAKPGEFASALGAAINGLEGLRTEADSAVQNFLAGGGEDLHNVALSVQRADLAFELGLQIRNKVVDAYQEIMRMQL